jgi:spermidine/putrescine transport system substrate-binding protein
MHNTSQYKTPYRQFILSLCFLVGSILHVNSFADSDSSYTVQAGDTLGKIVSKNYHFSQRVTSKQQIMVAILRANPKAFRGGNIHLLKKVEQLLLPTENTSALIRKDEAVKIIKEHYSFFKKKQTGNFPPIPLQRPITASIEKVISTKKNEVIETTEESKKEVIIGMTNTVGKKTIVKIKIKVKVEDEDAFSTKKTNEPKKETNIGLTDTVDKKTIVKVEDTSVNKSSSLHVEQKMDTENKSQKIRSNNTQKEAEITIYNWVNFLPKDVLTNFTQETGIKVNYFTYNKSELMYQKVKALNGRGYDLLITSTDLVQKMRNSGFLQAIDHRKLEYLKYLNPKLLNRPYDPNNKFSIPYLWTSIGLGVNTDQLNGVNITTWQDLWHKQWKNKLLLRDDMLILFAIALKVNGYSISSKNPDEIKQAYKTLRKLIPNIKKLSNETKLNLEFINSKASIGTFSGTNASKLKQKHPIFQYIYPKEGAIFLVASFIIPANASHVENAYTFINYLLRPEIAARCANEIAEATPNLEAIKLLDKNTRQDNTLFPQNEVFEQAEIQEGTGKMASLYQLYWKKFKQELKMKELEN